MFEGFQWFIQASLIRHTEIKRSCEDVDRDWSDAATSQGTPRIARSHQKSGERHRTDSPSDPPGGTNLGLISDF